MRRPDEARDIFRGNLIVEGLAQLEAISGFWVTRIEVLAAGPDSSTPWLDRWTVLGIEVPVGNVERLVRAFSENIDAEHSSVWYLDLRSTTRHYFAFANRIFRIDRENAALGYAAVREWALTLGISPDDLDFPEIDQ